MVTKNIEHMKTEAVQHIAAAYARVPDLKNELSEFREAA